MSSQAQEGEESKPTPNEMNQFCRNIKMVGQRSGNQQRIASARNQRRTGRKRRQQRPRGEQPQFEKRSKLDRAGKKLGSILRQYIGEMVRQHSVDISRQIQSPEISSSDGAESVPVSQPPIAQPRVGAPTATRREYNVHYNFLAEEEFQDDSIEESTPNLGLGRDDPVQQNEVGSSVEEQDEESVSEFEGAFLNDRFGRDGMAEFPAVFSSSLGSEEEEILEEMIRHADGHDSSNGEDEHNDITPPDISNLENSDEQGEGINNLIQINQQLNVEERPSQDEDKEENHEEVRKFVDMFWKKHITRRAAVPCEKYRLDQPDPLFQQQESLVEPTKYDARYSYQPRQYVEDNLVHEQRLQNYVNQQGQYHKLVRQQVPQNKTLYVNPHERVNTLNAAEAQGNPSQKNHQEKYIMENPRLQLYRPRKVKTQQRRNKLVTKQCNPSQKNDKKRLVDPRLHRLRSTSPEDISVPSASLVQRIKNSTERKLEDFRIKPNGAKQYWNMPPRRERVVLPIEQVDYEPTPPPKLYQPPSYPEKGPRNVKRRVLPKITEDFPFNQQLRSCVRVSDHNLMENHGIVNPENRPVYSRYIDEIFWEIEQYIRMGEPKDEQELVLWLSLFSNSRPVQIPAYQKITISTHFPQATASSADHYLTSTNTDYFTAIQCSADGNCFFNALSISLYGTEEYSKLLRIKTLYYIANDYDALEALVGKYSGFAESPISTLLDCATLGQWSNILTVEAAANALGLCINSCYPVFNGVNSDDSKVMNTVVFPSCGGQVKNVTILWWGPPKVPGVTWRTDHILPLIPNSPDVSTEAMIR